MYVYETEGVNACACVCVCVCVVVCVYACVDMYLYLKKNPLNTYTMNIVIINKYI